MDYYNDLAPSYDRLHGEEQKRKIAVIYAEISPQITERTRLLDIGSGTGLSLAPWHCQKVGIDPSPELVKIAKAKGLPVQYGTA